MTYRIPFNKPWLTGRETSHLTELQRTGHFSGDGPFSKRCQALLEEQLGAPKVLLTTSGTAALELSALLLGLRPGDEVILPSFTFVSTANAYVLRGARPVFADIRPDTLNIDESHIQELISEKTKAILPVHYAGVGCEMVEISRVAAMNDIPVVEDNALGLFGHYKGRPLGTFGVMAAQSFHETKSFSCGEGGALVINDESVVERAEVLRDKGTNRNKFFRGEVDKYTWVDIGSSFMPSDLLSAFLYAQLESRGEIMERRSRIWDRYFTGLTEWASRNNIALPFVPGHCDQAYAMFYILLPNLVARSTLIAKLKEHGILSVFHYQPLHTAPMGLRFGGCQGQLPVTEFISERILRLPFYTGMTRVEQDEVIDTITKSNL